MSVEAIYDNWKEAYHDYNHSRHCFWLYEIPLMHTAELDSHLTLRPLNMTF